MVAAAAAGLTLVGVDALKGESQGLQQLLHLGLFLGDQADIGHDD